MSRLSSLQDLVRQNLALIRTQFGRFPVEHIPVLATLAAQSLIGVLKATVRNPHARASAPDSRTG